MKIKQNTLEFKIILKISTTLVLGFLLMSLPNKLTGQELNYRFQYISTDDGLSQSTINCILQDNKGFMWIGTEDGLNKYDGYNFEFYYHDPDNPNSLSDNWITAIFEDKSGLIWIGTRNGLNRFDRKQNKFDRFKRISSEPASLSDNSVTAIYEDRFGKLWIGTEDGGLNVFNKKTKRFEHYKDEKKDNFNLSDDWVFSIYEDKKGNLWIGTNSGLNLFGGDYDHFIRFENDVSTIDSIESNIICSIFEDYKGTLWIGTEGGLFIFDREKMEFIACAAQYNLPENLFVRTIKEDSYGNVWVGSDNKGLFRYDRKNKKFKSFKSNFFHLSGTRFKSISSIYEDQSHVIWVGTEIGINKFNKNTKKFVNFVNEPSNYNTLSDFFVWSIIEDHLGYLWIGTDAGGVNRYDRKQAKFTIFKNEPEKPKILSDNCILSLCEDHLGAIWLGTYEGGLNVFNRENETFTFFPDDPDDSTSVGSGGIMALYEDRSGNMWAGTGEGIVSKFDREKKNFRNYQFSSVDTNYSGFTEIRAIIEDHNGTFWIGGENLGLVKFDPIYDVCFYYRNNVPNPLNSLSHNLVMCIHEDSTGILWIGTGGGGLNKFDPLNEKFTHYREEDGLPNETIYGILEEEPAPGEKVGNFWLSTNRGLSRFDPQNESFSNYDKEDGLQSNEFNANAFLKSKSGEMFFGGIHGFNSFYAKDINATQYKSPVVFTDFKLFNNSVPVGKNKDGRVILPENISDTKEIKLKHFENYFEIEFAALHYSASGKKQYRYNMEGLGEEWQHLGTRNFVAFNNVSPGNYIFNVKGTNNDGIWSPDVVSLKIKIIAPFWQKFWFKLLLYITIVLILFLGYEIKTRIMRTKNLQLEEWNLKLNDQIVERKKAEDKIAASLKEKEILLKEIHHRVKNNLQVISSLLYLQSKDFEDARASALFKESQSRVRSIALVHESLYQSENLAQIDFSKYINDLVNHLMRAYSANMANIRLDMKVNNIELDVDTAISCGLIITELVTNSLKYAFPGDKKGEIIIRFLSNKDKECELIVGDTGIGFLPGFNLNESKSLGLRLVNELVAQLNGSIDVDVQQGTSFKMKFAKKNKSKGTK